MKKYYNAPQSEAMTFAPEEHVMERQALAGSPSMIEPTTGAPTRHGNSVAVMYI